MKITFRIRKQKKNGGEVSYQDIFYETAGEGDTVAMALQAIENGLCTDESGQTAGAVAWECSCLQKKCGACAMLINGRPELACDARISDHINAEKGRTVITLEPLSKFPVIEDLRVDRSVMYDNLKDMKLYMNDSADIRSQKSRDTAYDASRCLQCGCCLEVCPNFYAGGSFFGAAAAASGSRVLSSEPVKASSELRSEYSRHVFAGCGKSLACRNICPAGIDIGHMLSNSNAISIWRRHA